MGQRERLIELNKISRVQLQSLINNKNVKELKGIEIKKIGTGKKK